MHGPKIMLNGFWDEKFGIKFESQRIDGTKLLVDPANVKDFKYLDCASSP